VGFWADCNDGNMGSGFAIFRDAADNAWGLFGWDWKNAQLESREVVIPPKHGISNDADAFAFGNNMATKYGADLGLKLITVDLRDVAHDKPLELIVHKLRSAGLYIRGPFYPSADNAEVVQ